MENGTEDLLMEGTDDVLESTETARVTLSVPLSLDSGMDVDENGDFSNSTKAYAAVKKTSGLRRELETGEAPVVAVRKDGPKPAKFPALPYSTSQTGLIYDVRMRFHVETEPSEDDLHPEDPRRIHAIYEAFVNAGLTWHEDSDSSSNYYMGRIDARLATQEEVCLVHTVEHWNWVQSLSTKRNEELLSELQHPPLMNDSIYLSTSTPYCAALSAGGAIEACRAVVLGKVKNVFAVIRPPGHHAEREDAKGFCFFDNVSIATKVCQREFGEACRKVFILDWDVHHGNGIQQANYDDPNVLYISLHVHTNKKGSLFYPEGSYRDNRVGYGNHLHCGSGAGIGKNVNIPWSRHGMGDADYIFAFQQVVMPIATEFDPDLVIIAAGFDAAEGDMLGQCHVTPAGYAHMTHMLMSLANGRLAVCLEGGYNLESIARSACAVGRTLMGEPPDRLSGTTPTNSAVDDVKRVLRQQSRFWASLYPKDLSARLNGPVRGVRMHNIVRKWQAETLFNDHGMTPLFIYRETLAEEFENQVLATPNYSEKRPLVVILHDPPEMLASPDPRTGKIELHNTWLTDVVKTYVDWAAKEGFVVIDANLPKHVSQEIDDDNNEYRETDSVEFLVRQATELLTYLWDNYIELSDSTHVILVGTNIGHGAIVNFIKDHAPRAKQRITKAISLIEDVSLLSVKSATDDELSDWYWRVSLVYVSCEHAYWSMDHSRKQRRRFGQITKSESNTISDMLLEHRDDIFESLLHATQDWTEEKPATEEMEEEKAELAFSPRKLPPVENFALSPAPKSLVGSQSSPGSGNGNRSPTKMHPMGNFAPSPKP